VLTKNDWADAFVAGDQYASFLKQEDERVAKVLKDIGLVQ
jgi:putative tricarboxylic transport membrane protein